MVDSSRSPWNKINIKFKAGFELNLLFQIHIDLLLFSAYITTVSVNLTMDPNETYICRVYIICVDCWDKVAHVAESYSVINPFFRRR